MTTLGKTDKFIPATGDWTQYIERMNRFFIANKISEEPRKKAVLLSSGGAETCSLLRNLVAAAKPSDKSYNELLRVMNEHQNPKPSVIMERYKFNKWDTQLGESILFMRLKLSICQNIVILAWLWKIWLGTGWFVVWGVPKFSKVC